jgi:YD repeat-containing protein
VFSTPAGYYFTFTKLGDGTYTINEKNGTTYTFQSISGAINQTARLISIRDVNNNILNLNYNGNNLVSVADGLASYRKLDFLYDASNRISQVGDWSGRIFKYEYDSEGNLSAVFNPLAVAGVQSPTRYAYYGGGALDHSLKSIVLPRGNGMNFEYYANGKMFKEYNSLGEANAFTFNEMRNESSFINKRGYTLRYLFNDYGAPVQVDDEVRGSTINTYDSTNPYLMLSQRNPLGFITAYTYDGNFNITQVTLPSQATIGYSNYNAFGSPGKVKDARGNYTILKYDLRGNLLERIALRSGVGSAVTDTQNYVPLAADLVARTINTYDVNSNILTSKKVRDFATNAGPMLTYGYVDAINGVNGLNVTSITRTGDRDGNAATIETDVATLTYDTLGRLVTGVRDNWYDTYAQYDELDRVVTFKDDFGKLRSNSYDPNGNLIKTWLVNGNSADVTTLTYDLADRKESSVSNGGGVSSFQYDAAGNVTKISNPDQYSLGIDYDGANRPFRAFDQAGHDVVTYMDQMGKPLQIVDPNGNRVVREYYDASKEGRLKVSRDAMGRGITTDYDAAGNATSVTDHLGGVTRTFYDELNRPVRVVGPLLTASGNVRPLKTMIYNALGYVINIKMGQTDASGSNYASDTVAWQTNYTWDDYGHKLSETDGLNKTRTFTYDLYGNMTSATSP